MKRPYQKPYLGVESFQLNAAIALTCGSQGFTPIKHYADGCGFDGFEGNWQYFNLFNCQVDLTGPGNDGNDSICYHGPTASHGQIFTWS